MQAEGAALGLELLDWPCLAQQCQKEPGQRKPFGNKVVNQSSATTLKRNGLHRHPF